MRTIRNIISEECTTPSKPEFTFELTKEAVIKNFLVLKRHRLHLGKALESQANSPLGYGSEFRHPSKLEDLFSRHPNWSHLRSILLNGSQWKLEHLDKEMRVKDEEEALKFGNHKGATDKPELLRELVDKDVVHGYALPVPLNKIRLIPGICMAPMNIAPQNTIDEHGNIIGKTA